MGERYEMFCTELGAALADGMRIINSQGIDGYNEAGKRIVDVLRLLNADDVAATRQAVDETANEPGDEYSPEAMDPEIDFDEDQDQATADFEAVEAMETSQ